MSSKAKEKDNGAGTPIAEADIMPGTPPGIVATTLTNPNRDALIGKEVEVYAASPNAVDTNCT